MQAYKYSNIRILGHPTQKPNVADGNFGCYMHRLDSGAAANITRTGTHLHLAILHGAAL